MSSTHDTNTNNIGNKNGTGTNNGSHENPDIEIYEGFFCRNENHTLRVLSRVKKKPGMWHVRVSVIGWSFLRSKVKPSIEMSEEKLLELYHLEKAADAIKSSPAGFSTAFVSESYARRKPNQTTPKGPRRTLSRRNGKPNRFLMIDAALRRVDANLVGART